jgi:uncharacterized protein with PIN domain
MILEEIKYCKYCNSELKKIDYEIIELDKTNHFERYHCKKCFKMFHFREPTQIKTKKPPRKKTKKIKNEIRKQNN